MGEERVQRVAAILHEAAETHHVVFRITDGADDDWASWYSDWLTRLSELAEVVGAPLVRSELTWLLVGCDKDYSAAPSDEAWETVYARRFLEHFGS